MRDERAGLPQVDHFQPVALRTGLVAGFVPHHPTRVVGVHKVGGKFQGSSSADFSTGVIDLFTISTRPNPGALTRVAITVKTPFRYVRYLSPEEGCGNVAEVEFWGADPGGAVAAGPATRANAGTPPQFLRPDSVKTERLHALSDPELERRQVDFI